MRFGGIQEFTDIEVELSYELFLKAGQSTSMHLRFCVKCLETKVRQGENGRGTAKVTPELTGRESTFRGCFQRSITEFQAFPHRT
jgi:hypothetical protein